MCNEGTHMGPFCLLPGEPRGPPPVSGHQPCVVHTVWEQGGVVATERREAPCWRPRRLWKVLVVIALQVEGKAEREPREGTCDQIFCIRSSVS